MSGDLATEWLRQIGAILPTDPDLLLTSEEHAALNEHLALIGWQRQAVIATCPGCVHYGCPDCGEGIAPGDEHYYREEPMD